MKNLFPILLLVLLFSCSKPQGFDYKGMKNFKIEKLGFEKSKISMDLTYYNPNNFGVNLKQVDCEIYVNEHYLGKYKLDTTLHIPKKSEFSLPSKIDVDMKNIFKNAFSALFSNEVTVKAKGRTRVGKAGIFVNVPFNYEGKHKFELF
jgi:LEA14-like dessication related protein